MSIESIPKFTEPAAKLWAPTVTNTVITNLSAPSKGLECKALDAQITQFDAMARQPQSGQMQDWITGEKKKARDRQFSIKC